MDNYMKWILLPILLSLSFISSILGLPPTKSIQFQHIKEKDGLSSNQVNAILQDSRGFLWFGTMEGLHRYDGHKLKIFRNNPRDSTSISHDYILSLFEDREGTLWVGTITGLNQFFREKESFIRYYHDSTDVNSLSYNTIAVIYEDRNSILWIGTYSGGLNSFDKKSKKFKRYLHDPENSNSLGNNNVYGIHQDYTGKLWIGTENGLNCLDIQSGMFIHYLHDPRNLNSLIHNTVYSLHEEKDGSLWLGTRGGLTRLDRERKNFTHYNRDAGVVSSDRIPRIIFKLYGDQKGKLWLATSTCGLTEFDLKTKQFDVHGHDGRYPESIGANRTMTACLDRQGTHWVGLRDDGISSYNPLRNKFPQFNFKKTVSENVKTYVKSAFADQDDKLWIGASFGLLKFDARTEQYDLLFKPANKPVREAQEDIAGSNLSIIPSKLYRYNIVHIHQDKDSSLWIATNGGGLINYNPNSRKTTTFLHHKNSPNSLSSNYLDCILKDSYGKVWIQTNNGQLNILDVSTGDVERHTQKSRTDLGFSNEYISMFFEDSHNQLWIATHGDGLYRYDRRNNRFVTFKHNPNDSLSLSDDVVTTIYESRSGQIWIGTAMGLNRLDRQTNRFYSSDCSPELTSSYVKGILEDDSENLWLCGFSTISKIDVKNSRSLTFGADDGINIKFTEDNICSRDSHGYLYFAGKDGFIYFHPDSIRLNDYIPPVVLTDLRLMNKSVNLDSSINEKKCISLPYNRNHFSIEFAALDYISPASNKYAYMLEGLENEWIYTNTNTAHYTNIDPGTYVFHVKASNNDDIWNETGALLKIIIIPPWWATWWAYTVYVVLCGIVILGGGRYEIHRRDLKHRAVVAELQARTVEAQKEAEKEQMRGRIASDLHDEIGSNLSSIAILGEVLEKKLDLPEKEKKRLQQIPGIARISAEAMRDIVWFVNPSNDSFDMLLKKMRETANLMLEGLEVDFSETVNGSESNTDLNFRRNLFLVYKEILQNIIRHARATKVSVSFNLDNGKFSLCIKDNGIGFDTNMEFTGNGLKNYQRRAAEMNTNIVVESDPGVGTQVKISSIIP